MAPGFIARLLKMGLEAECILMILSLQVWNVFMVEEIITCSTVSKTYGTIVALKNISLSINRGESVALVGANGAGKSTLFNIMLGLLKADEGTCTILGTDTKSLTQRHRARIGFIADHAGPIPWASAHDLATLYRNIYPSWNKTRFDSVTTAWHIDIYRRLNNLSKGQKRLAEIALVTAIQPQIVILDEPFDGLDAVMRIKIQKLLRELHGKDGITILYATHIISEVSSVADRMVVLQDGMLAYDELVMDSPETPEEVFRRLYTAELNA